MFAAAGHLDDGLVETAATVQREQHGLEVGVEGKLDAALTELLAT